MEARVTEGPPVQTPYAQTEAEAHRLRRHFADWYRERGYGQAAATLERD